MSGALFDEDLHPLVCLGCGQVVDNTFVLNLNHGSSVTDPVKVAKFGCRAKKSYLAWLIWCKENYCPVGGWLAKQCSELGIDFDRIWSGDDES